MDKRIAALLNAPNSCGHNALTMTTHTHIHTHPFNGPLSGTTRVSQKESSLTRKVKPIWISLKQETVSGSGISWAICKSAPRSGQTATPAPDHSVFCRPVALPAAQSAASKHQLIDQTEVANHTADWPRGVVLKRNGGRLKQDLDKDNLTLRSST